MLSPANTAHSLAFSRSAMSNPILSSHLPTSLPFTPQTYAQSRGGHRSFKRRYSLTIDAVPYNSSPPRHCISPITIASSNTTVSSDSEDDYGSLCEEDICNDRQQDRQGLDTTAAPSSQDSEAGVSPPQSQVPNMCRDSMTKEYISTRIWELTGFKAKEVQLDAIEAIICQRVSLLLIAKTGFGKSLIFNMLPVVFPDRKQTTLVLVPLKHIGTQQVEAVTRFAGARGFVLNKDSNKKVYRKQIANGDYTHGTSYTSPLDMTVGTKYS